MSSSFDSYQILYKTSSDSTYTYYDSSSSLTPVITSLSPNTGYYIQLIPYSNTSGLYGSAIETYSVTLAKLTNFTFGQVNAYDITLNWTGNYNYVKIFYGITSGIYTNSVNSNNNNKTITGLISETPYYFNIVPYNSANISSSYYKEISTTTSIAPVVVYSITYSGTYTKSDNIYYLTEGSNSTLTVNVDCNVKILLVGGGGGGGYDGGGGGGAGGVIYLDSSYLYVGRTYQVTIGSGGANGTSVSTTGSIGGNTYITELNLTAIGGGGGGTRRVKGLNGGCGGGAGHADNLNTYSGGSGTTNQGYSGGSSYSTSGYGGGGGGAGGAGTSITTNTTVGNGGIGFQNSITGTNTYYGGGGGGGNWQQTSYGGSIGGSGGGGAGGYGSSSPTVGSVNTGGGGGGGGGGSYKNGASGGSGIIIIAIKSYRTGLTSFTFGQVNSTDITLNWTGNYSYVKIHYGLTSGTYTDSVTSYDTNKTITGLPPNTIYYFNIAPYNSLDASAGYYGEINTTTLANLTSFTFGQVNSTDITLNWTGNYSYVMIYYGIIRGTYTDSVTSYDTSKTITGLTANTPYYFNITPYNSLNTSSSYYGEINTTTLANLTSFTTSQVNKNDITVNWTGTFSTVSIYYGTSSSSLTQYATSETGNSKIITGLTSKQIYYFDIKPYNSAGQTPGFYRQISETTLENFEVTAIPIYTSTSTTDTTGTITKFMSNTLIVTGSVGYFAYANGTYECSASSSYSNESLPYEAANNTDNPGTDFWHCLYTITPSPGSYPYSKTTGLHQIYTVNGTQHYYSTTVIINGTNQTLYGEWIQYKLPYNLKLKSYIIKIRGTDSSDLVRFPYYFTIAGSTNGLTWYSLDRQSNIVPSNNIDQTYSVTTSNSYNYFRLIITQLKPANGAEVVNMARFNLIGDRS